MKKLLSILVVIFSITFCQAQYFQATMTNQGNDLVFSIRPNPGGGNITTGWSDIEFFVRWPSNSAAFNFGAITVNNTNFPGVPIALNGQNAQGSEVGFNNRWFGSSFSVTDTTTYTDGTEYELFRVTLDSPASGINFELIHNTNFSPTYLVLTSQGGVDLANPTGNKFYGANATICAPQNYPPSTSGTNHIAFEPPLTPVCSITAISTSSLSTCTDNGTPNDSTDDTFTGDVTITFENSPATGTLELMGDGVGSIAVTGLTTTHTFTGVSMSADCTAINLTASFSATAACTFNNTNAGTAPGSCGTVVPDCNTITYVTTANSLTINNLVAPIVQVQIFDTENGWATVLNCSNNCDVPTTVLNNLAQSVYYVRVKFYTSNWQTICERIEQIEIGGVAPCANNGGDADGDGA